jgi:hypothetical protein
MALDSIEAVEYEGETGLVAMVIPVKINVLVLFSQYAL